MSRVQRVFELAGKVCLIGTLLLQLATAASWGCVDVSVPSGYGTCAVPKQCGSEYQGAIVCYEEDQETSEADCTDPKPPAAEPVSSGCDPLFTSASVTYDPSEHTLTVGFKINDPSEFFGNFNYIAALDFSLWDADISSAECTGEVSCSVTNSALTATLSNITMDGSFVVENVVPRSHTPDAKIGVDFTREDSSDSLYKGSSPLSAGPINILTVAPAFSAAAFAPGVSRDEAAAGSVLLSLSMGGHTAFVPGVGVTSLLLETSVELLGCEVAADSAENDAPWPLTLAFSSAPLSGTAPAYTLSLTSISSVAASLGHVFMVCNVSSSPSPDATITASFDAVTHLAVAPAVPVAHLAEGSTTPDAVFVASYEAVVSADAIDTSALTDALGAQTLAADGASSGLVTIKVSVEDSHRVFSSVLTENVFLSALAAAANANTATAPASLAFNPASAAARMIQAGVWMCGDETDFAECEIANNCGTVPTKPFVCAVLNKTGLAAPDACLFVDQSTTKVTKGCGIYLCRSLFGGHTQCNDKSVCFDGCDPSPRPITAADHDSLRLKAVCVKNSLEVDAALFCPSSVVAAPVYAESCIAKSTCTYLCGKGGGQPMSCMSEASWSSCSAQCGQGKQERNIYCSPPDATDSLSTPVLDESMCEYATPPPRTRACRGTDCESYLWDWTCSPDNSTFVSCELASSWSTCDVTCGSSYQTRNVFCAIYHADGTRVGVDEPLEQCETKRSRPADTRSCSNTVCDGVQWMCHLPSAPVSTATFCNDTAAFGSCPTEGCSATSILRSVVCLHKGAVVDSALCAHLESPEPAVFCEPVTDTCDVTFAAAECAYTADGERSPALEGTYCDPGTDGFEVYRRGACVNEAGNEVDGELCGASRLLEKCNLPPCSSQFSFKWAVTPGQCQNLDKMCETFRINTVRCTATTTNGGTTMSVVVPDSHCPTSARPPVISQCSKADGVRVCEWGGICAKHTGPVYVNGVTFPSATFGQCTCVPGFGGNFCLETINISSVLTRIADGTDLEIGWFMIGTGRDFDPLMVSIDFQDRVFEIPVGVVRSNVGRVYYPLDKIARFVPQPSTITVVTEIADMVTTGDMVLQPLCTYSGYKCQNGGTCSPNGSCACRPGFSGTTCEVSACSVKGCNPETSTCALANGIASCVCETGPDGEKLFADDLCFTPLGCDDESWACAHGGIPTGSIVNETTPVCGDCICKNNYGGDFCNECILDHVCVHGVPEEDCSKCVCEAGYVGENCGCRQIEMSFLIRLSPDTDWYTYTDRASPLFSVWEEGMEQSFRFIFGSDPVSVRVLSHGLISNTNSGRTMLRVSVGVSPQCDSFFTTSVSGDLGAPSSAAAQQKVLQDAFESFSTKFQTGVLKRHRMLRHVDYAAGVRVTDSACVAPNCIPNIGNGGEAARSNKSSGLTTGEKLGIGLGVGIGAIVLVAVVILICRYDVFCSSKISDENADGHFRRDSLEMAAHTQQRMSSRDSGRDSHKSGSARNSAPSAPDSNV